MADTSPITQDYIIDYSQAKQALGVIKTELGTHEDAYAKLRRTDPYAQLADNATKYNRVLENGSRLYQKVSTDAKGYEQELKRLQAIEKELIRTNAEFKNSMQYDQAKRDLAAVRDRINDISEALREVPKKNEAAKKSFHSLGDSIKTAFQVTGILFLIDSVVSFGKKLIDIGGQVEGNQNQFTRIFEGNKAAAKGYLADLQNVADVTNFTFDTLTDNAAKLASRGVLPMRKELLGIGDVANFIKKDFSQLNEAILDVNNSERWKELGFVVVTQGNKMKLSYGDFTTTVDKSVKGAYDAIQAFSKLGKVQGSTEEAGKTLSGRMSTLSDNFAGLFRTIATGNSDVLGSAIDSVSRFISFLIDLAKGLQPAFSGLFDLVGKLGESFGGLIEAFQNLFRTGDKVSSWGQIIGYVIKNTIIDPITLAINVISQLIESFNTIIIGSELLAAKLSGNKSWAATLQKQLSESGARLKELRTDFGKTFRELNTTLDEYVRQDEIRKRRAERRQRLDEEALAGFKPTPKTKLPDPSGQADKDANRLAEERRKLLKQLLSDQQKYEESLAKLELEAQNIRLGMLDKFSDQYLAEKKAYDKKVLDQEKEAQVALYAESIKNIHSFKDAAGKTQLELRSLLKETEDKYRAQGQTTLQARSSAIKEITPRFNSDPVTKPLREINDLKQQVLEKNSEEENLARLKQFAKERTDMLGAGFDKENALIQAKYDELIKTYKGKESLIAELREKQQLETEKLRNTSNQAELDKRAQNERSLLELSGKRQAESETEYQARKNKALLELDKEYYTNSLNELIKYTSSLSYIRAVADGKISKEEAESNERLLTLLKAQVESSTKAVADGGNAQRGLLNTYKDTWELFSVESAKFFGEDSGLAKFFKDPKNEQATKAMFESIKSAISEFLSFEIDQSKERIALYDQEVNEETSLLEKERENQKEGLANNYDAVKQDLANTKAAREDEKQHLAKIQKEKAAIDVAEAASAQLVTAANLIAATAKVMSGTATIPFAGVALGIALIATLFSAFTSIKSKIATATKLRKGKGKLLEGDTHENGGLDIIDPKTGQKLYEAEGGERLMGTAPSKKYNNLLEHINEDTFKNLSGNKQLDLLRPLGIRLTEPLGRDASQTLANLGRIQQHQNTMAQVSAIRDLNETFKQVADNTNRIPSTQKVATQKEVRTYKGDKLIDIESL